MVMMRVLSTMIAVGLLAVPRQAAEEKLALTGDNTKITFVGSKADGKHEGGFKKLTGSATFDGTNATSLKIAVEIDMNSTYTDNDMLTGHLKGPDFFGVKANPKSKF